MHDLQAAFDTMKSNVAENFKGNWCPMIVGYTPDIIIPVLMPWDSTAEKHACIDVTRMQFKAMGVIQYAASFECWMAASPAPPNWPAGKDEFYPPNGVMPRDNPNRKEIMFVIAENIDGGNLAGYWNIGRRGKRAFVTTFESMTGPDRSFQTAILTNMFGRSMLQ